MTTEGTIRSLGPFALSLSGGGGRAAAFHLGTMSYLDRLDILKDVSILSSVSGGTFTAAKYALTLKQAPEGEDLHDTFRRFFDDFYEFLLTADLVPRAFERLRKEPKSPSPRRTTVKALADVYDETFMDGARFETFFKGREIHLKDITFNSTECTDGLAFRFRVSEQPETIGSSKLWIKREHAEALRMGDVVAASSDIPVGLEPLHYPQDFVWPKDKPNLWLEAKAHLENWGVETLPMADGGVIDNQGIEGVMLAARTGPRGSGDPLKDDPQQLEDWYFSFIPQHDELGLYIISDVPSLHDPIYKPSITALMGAGRTKPGGRMTLGRLRILGWAAFVVSGITVAEVIAHAISLGRPFGPNWDVNWGIDIVFLHVVPLSLAGGVIALLIWLRLEVGKLLRLADRKVPHLHLWDLIKHLTVFDLAYMVGVRLSSTWFLTSTIFLNRIRRLMYYAIYSVKMAGDPATHQPAGEDPAVRRLLSEVPLKSRLIPSEIYCLEHDHKDVPEWLQPTAAMKKIGKDAADVGTTLWLTQKQIDHLVLCGQITTCFSTLKCFLQLPKEESQLFATHFTLAREHWEELKRDPRALLPQDRSPQKAPPPDDPLVRKAKA